VANDRQTSLPTPLPDDPVRVCDFAERLNRLNAFHDQKRIDEAQLTEELNRVCVEVWGCTRDDVDETLLPPDDRKWFDEADEFDAVEYAERHGYDLGVDGLIVLRDWKTFLFMILALTLGILPKENQATLKLRREAKRFVEGKAKGTISGQ
jgi:hypothetical protein